MAQSVKCLLNKYNLNSELQNSHEKAQVCNTRAEKTETGGSWRSLAGQSSLIDKLQVP